ncbi:MAG: AAA family ATPase [Deltaproteobacteria bacterium]|nr:AAA family ATPase [Deltaproteobacteria bacterium]
MSIPQPASPDPRALREKFQRVADALASQFLGKEETARLMLICAAAGEHLVLIGPPGTAKSAVVRSFARLVDARYFEYLLTRFSEPNEVFGPVDLQAFRAGRYHRVTTGMLPEAEIAFLDEAFKANSAILNSLLSILNERRFSNGADTVHVPLISMFAASNEVPQDDALHAIFDRFIIRVHADNVDSFHFHDLLQKGLALERAAITEREAAEAKIRAPLKMGLAAADLQACQKHLLSVVQFPEDFLATYKGLCFQIRAEGVSLSDRRAVKLLKLFAASAVIDGRAVVHDGDLAILRHIWNQMDQREILHDLVDPVVTRFFNEHPETAPRLPRPDLDKLVTELTLVHRLLTSGQELSDIQVFSHLRALDDLRKGFQVVGGPTAQQMIDRIDALTRTLLEGRGPAAAGARRQGPAR